MSRQDEERLIETALAETDDPLTAVELVTATRLRPRRLFVVLDSLVARGRAVRTQAGRTSVYAKAERP